MPDDEKSKLYLYSVPPPYQDADDIDDAGTGPSFSSSIASENRNSAENGTTEERQQFLGRDRQSHQDGGNRPDSESIDFTTPRTSIDSAELRREITQFEIIEPPLVNLQRPGVPSRIASTLKVPFHFFSRIGSSFNSTFPVFNNSYSAIKIKYAKLASQFDRYLERIGNPLLMKRLAVVLLFSMGLWLIIASGMLPLGSSAGGGRSAWPPQHYDLDSMREFYMARVSSANIAKQLKHLAELPRVAGTQGDVALTEYMVDQFKEMEVFSKVELQEYDVFLTYADTSSQRLAILDNKKRSLIYEAELREAESIPGAYTRQPFPIHGLSASGNVTGPLVYANFGTKKDFEWLKSNSVNIEGSVVICKYGLVHESLKIHAAELYKAAAVIIFRDKTHDQSVYPDGTSIPEGAVQRGSAALRNFGPGDVLSPGWAAIPNAPKYDKANVTVLPQIPSMPISWSDAKHFISALQGHGKKVGESWKIEFSQTDETWTGNENGPIINLVNKAVEKDSQPIWNVIAKLEGIEQDEKAIILGAHRDAWCYGASDAMCGTAILLEVARQLSYIARVYDWRPLRSIYFISWDGTEQNLIGSTEWVEQNIDFLRRDGSVYINLDQAISGDKFEAAGNPLLESALLSAMQFVEDPLRNKTMREIWATTNFDALEGDKDTIAFQSFAGIASIDLGFRSKTGYPTRTCFDNVEWMEKFGDPTSIIENGNNITLTDPGQDVGEDGRPYIYHKMLTKLVGSMIIRLSDELSIPFDFSSYARHIVSYLNDLEAYAGSTQLDTNSIREAISELSDSAIKFEGWLTEWRDQLSTLGHMETTTMTAHRWSRNSRMVNFDKHLLDEEGLPGRPWFKHVLFAPQLWPPTVQDNTFKSSGTFPSVRDALERGDAETAQRELDRISNQIMKAANKLVD
ncbi:hypothetical protein V1514DRAFT_294585 [Lipomyces japonicus]|uniref:uncharacterized protein n=1 Tax=Lipomyces japonicus TaxID=56871 RepID=UPI0034CE4ED5